MEDAIKCAPLVVWYVKMEIECCAVADLTTNATSTEALEKDLIPIGTADVHHVGNEPRSLAHCDHNDACSAPVFFLLAGKPGRDMDNRTRLCYMGDPSAPCTHVNIKNGLVDHLFENAFHYFEHAVFTLPDGHKEGLPRTMSGHLGSMECHSLLHGTEETTNGTN